MTHPHTLFPSTLPTASVKARPRAMRASSAVLCALGMLGAVACSDNTGDDVIQASPRSSEDDRPSRNGTTPPSAGSEGPGLVTGAAGGARDDDESGIDDEDEISARSGGTRAVGGGGGGRRRTSDDDDDDDVELEDDAGVPDAGDVDAGVIVEDGGVVVEDDAGVVLEDAGADAG